MRLRLANAEDTTSMPPDDRRFVTAKNGAQAA
jgi:hypothetical protein